MLPPPLRLPLREYKDFFKTARKQFSPLFLIYWQKSDQPTSKAQVVVSKKVARSAVVRNRVKRKLRHVLSDVLPQRQGLSIVVIANKKTLLATSQELMNEVMVTLRKLG